jgi:NAD(P)H-flavin reductase
VSGTVRGGEGAEPGIVHACQCRIAGDAVIVKDQPPDVRTVEGVLSSLRPLSREVMEVGIRTHRALPYHAGQYVQVRFRGYPSRPFSITHALQGNPSSPSGLASRLVLVATNTGFAPIWSIAVAALRENPERMMMIIVGGRTIESLYMAPALVQLARFPNVLVVPVCSTAQTSSNAVSLGRPTDYLPRLLPTDVLYACGAPAMVESVKSIAAHVGAVCHADPFLPTAADMVEESALTRASRRLVGFTSRQMGRLALDRGASRRGQPVQAHRMAEAKVRSHHLP